MGREVSPLEHSIPGKVWVGRGVDHSIELPPDLKLAQDEALLRIRQIKIIARDRVGFIALNQAEGLPTINPEEKPSLENFRLQ